ncbi:MAG: hypothetical protein ACTSRI_14220 [Promethearchaeota archaeon]
MDFNILEKIQKKNLAENINQIFQDLLNELQFFLNLDINPQIKILYNKTKTLSTTEKQDIFNLGVKRSFKNGFLTIEFFTEQKKYWPIILLRECYYAFIPEALKESLIVKIVINQIIENDLYKLDVIKEWISLVRKSIVNYGFLTAQFDRLEKFLKLKGTNFTESPKIFFFEYIRRNYLLIKEGKKDFYDKIFNEFVFKSSKNLKQYEIIETLRVLIEIFYSVKSYRALLEYQHYFKEFKQNGEIKTDLSLRKFSSNMQWINKFSYIAPSYYINWNAINCIVIICTLRFNPLIDKKKVNSLIENLPFFLNSKSSENNFAIEVSGFFIAPRVFLKDIRNFLEKLEKLGYIINKTSFLYNKHENNLNLNYFREFYNKGRIINPKRKLYDKKYEIQFKIDFGKKFNNQRFSILEFLILDRVRYFSITGFTFERRTEGLKALKSDLVNEIYSQYALIKELKNNLKIFQFNQEFKKDLLKFLEKKKNLGFFYTKELLDNLIKSVNLVENFLLENQNIKNIYQFQDIIRKKPISQFIYDNIIFNENIIKKMIFQEFLPIYYQNKKKFKEELEKYSIFRDFFKSCHALKIFNFKAMERIIQEEDLIGKIFSIKENKLKKVYESFKIQKIKSSDIDDIIDSFLTKIPPIISPILITTISTNLIARYYIQLILKKSSEVQRILNKIKKYFPRVILLEGVDIFTNEEVIQVEIYLPNINEKEKEIFVSILFYLFKENIISLKRYFYDGIYKAFSRKDYYDFEKKEFFYTKDLFEQYFIYTKKLFGRELKPFQEKNKKFNNEMFWTSEKNIKNLIFQVKDRISREQIDFDPIKLNKLLKFHSNLIEVILDIDNYKTIKQTEYFKKYVKAIKLKPSFQAFGLGQYYLYIRPININELDFRLLLTNTFQKIKYPAYIDDAKSFFIKYLFPHSTPNMAYINWLSKSKKGISEYCLFSVKKIHQIFHFDYNLSSKGWDLDPNRFKMYFQKVLFNPDFKVQILTKDYNIGGLTVSDYHGQDSPFFNDLTQIYNSNSIDIKSVLITKKKSQINSITTLLKDNLIFPYLKLKNLDLKEKIYIILPNTSQEINDILIKIFNFFNFGFIYEIEGEYHVKGFEKTKKFENGLFIKLFLPDCEISDFQRLFHSIFQFLKIKKYLVLNDLIDGKNLIKSIYGNLNFLKTYSPLKNLKWNDKDGIWMNHKLFGENFEPLYPELI